MTFPALLQGACKEFVECWWLLPWRVSFVQGLAHWGLKRTIGYLYFHIVEGSYWVNKVAYILQNTQTNWKLYRVLPIYQRLCSFHSTSSNTIDQLHTPLFLVYESRVMVDLFDNWTTNIALPRARPMYGRQVLSVSQYTVLDLLIQNGVQLVDFGIQHKYLCLVFLFGGLHELCLSPQ